MFERHVWTMKDFRDHAEEHISLIFTEGVRLETPHLRLQPRDAAFDDHNRAAAVSGIDCAIDEKHGPSVVISVEPRRAHTTANDRETICWIREACRITQEK